jgi:hypothetical protein
VPLHGFALGLFNVVTLRLCCVSLYRGLFEQGVILGEGTKWHRDQKRS